MLGAGFPVGPPMVPDAPPAGVLPLLLPLPSPLSVSFLIVSGHIRHWYVGDTYDEFLFFFRNPTARPTIRAIIHNITAKTISSRFHPPLFAICLLLLNPFLTSINFSPSGPSIVVSN